jgi:hypothetical protein
LLACEQSELLLRYFDELVAAKDTPPWKRAYELAVDAADRVDPDRATTLIKDMKAKEFFQSKHEKQIILESRDERINELTRKRHLDDINKRKLAQS